MQLNTIRRCGLGCTLLTVMALGGSAQSPSDPLRLSIDFNGVDRIFGGMPPDITIAAGPRSLVLSSNDSVTIRDKSGGQIATAELNRFFSSVKTDRERLIDPTVYFDPDSYRFFLVASGAYRDDSNCGLGACVGHIFLAASKTDSPASTEERDWYFYAFDATIEAGVRTRNFPDQTRVAADDRIAVIVSSQFRFADHGDQHPMIRILDKSRVIRGAADTWTDFVGMQNPNGSRAQQFMPVHPLDRPATGTTFVLNALGCDLGVWGIEDASVSPRLIYRLAQPLIQPSPNRTCAQPPNAPQPGAAPPLQLANVPTLQVGPVYRSGSIWATEHIRANYGSGDVSAIRWVQIDVSKWPASVRIVQDGTFGADGTWHFFPALTVDPSNNVAIVYGRSNTREFPSAYYTGRLWTDPPNTLRPGALLKAGEASQNHWTGDRSGTQMYGDYFGAALDPVNHSAWIIGEYVKTPDKWGTWVGNIRFPAPSPSLSLSGGQSVRSANGQFRLTYEMDGNLVLYDNQSQTALWSTNTAGTSAGRAVMQLDGNFVVYDAEGQARWSSNTAGNPAAYFVIQNDGNLVIYSPNGEAIWDRYR